MIKKLPKALFFLIVLISGCKPRSVLQKLPESIHIVHIEELIDHKGKYHGKTIQTKGLYILSFETSALLPYTIISDSSEFRVQPKSHEGLWVETAQYPPDTVRNKQGDIHHFKVMTVQGELDTTIKGHMGFYIAAIKNGRFVLSQ